MTTTHPMPSADAAWFHMDRPTNHMVINSVLTFDEPVDLGRLRDLLRERLVEPFPRFRQVVVEAGPLRSPHWRDDDRFDIDLHLHRRHLAPPGDQAALRELVADLMSASLDPGKPLWDWYLVDGYGDGCAVIVRMHHCIADGIALAQVMLGLTDVPGADGRPAVEPPRAPRRGLPLGPAAPLAAPVARLAQPVVALAGGALGVVRHPRRLPALGREARDDAIALAEILAAPSENPSALKGDHGVAQRVAWTPPLPLADVKEVAHATGTTVNDVLMAALGGGLARYLGDREEQVDELHAMVPFNIRPADRPLPADLGNRFGLILIGLPLRAAGALERLAEVHRRMVHIKSSRQPAMSYAILGAMGRTPQALERRIVDLFSAKSTAVVTNVPGPREAVHLAGVPVREVLVWAPCASSVGMSVSIFSYRDTVTVGYMTHASLVPDPGALASHLVDELAELRRAARAL